MRAIFILSIFIVLILSGCTTIEVAKEVSKATNSIKNTIKKISSNEERLEEEKLLEINKEEEKEGKLKNEILVQKKVIVVEKKKEEQVDIKQNKFIKTNLIGKTLEELTRQLGKPKLLRKDGKTITARFDSKSCRIFFYFHTSIKKSFVEYYELRNSLGELVARDQDIRKCFKEIKLS